MTAQSHSRVIDVSSEAVRDVSVDRVAAELGRVWADISRQVEERSGQLPLRMSVLTLIIVARGAAQTRAARGVLAELVEQLPSRAILLEIGRPGSPFDASISANCRYLNAGRAACYEVIEVRAPSDRLSAIPSLLVPLELFDVPSFMWWVGEVEFDSSDFRRLAASAKRIIIDSARFDDVPDALASYDGFLQESETTCTGTDLTWARSTSWRELIAQAFDHPITCDLLGSIQRADIAFDPSAEAQGLLLTGWLATRLGWTLTDAARGADETTLQLSCPAGQVTVNLGRQASAGVGLRAVRILAGNGSKTARISIRRRGEDIVAVGIEVAGMARQERVVRDRQPRLSELIGKELLIHARDPVFDESLDFLSTVVGRLREEHG
jgi:glucose-6-phosphate dehydrogenase assembly protein OpcA